MAANAFDACVDHRSPFETIQWPQTHSVLPAVATAPIEFNTSHFETIQWPQTHSMLASIIAAPIGIMTSHFETIQWPQTHSMLASIIAAPIGIMTSHFETIQWPQTHSMGVTMRASIIAAPSRPSSGRKRIRCLRRSSQPLRDHPVAANAFGASSGGPSGGKPIRGHPVAANAYSGSQKGPAFPLLLSLSALLCNQAPDLARPPP